MSAASRRLARRHPLEPLEHRVLLAAELVKDINPLQAGSSPTELVAVGSSFFFVSTDADHGTELWKSDGTSGGTVLVKDIFDGPDGSTPQYLTNVNGTLYFRANDGVNGIELWKSDGTTDGTVLVKDIQSGPDSSNLLDLVNFNGTLFFDANDGSTGFELWKSNGTAAGTVLVKDIRSGASGTPRYLTNVNGTLYFKAHDGVNGYELWKSNGTTAGTVLAKDIRSGPTGSSLSNFTNVNGTLYFTADDGVNGMELWKTDSAGTTTLVQNIRSGLADSSPSNLTNVNGTLYFTANDGTHGVELWKSNASGTSLVGDLRDGTASSSPSNLTNVNGTLFFTANDGTHGVELWKVDNSTGGAVLVQDIATDSASSTPQFLTNVNGTLYFSASDGSHGVELWKVDNSTGGAVLVQDFVIGSGGSSPKALTNINGQLYFSADDGVHGAELWRLVENQPPSAVDLLDTTTSLAENTVTTSRIKVADIQVVDDGSGTNTISLSGTDAASFETDSGVLYLKAGTALNFEVKSSYFVTINVTDLSLGTAPQASKNFTLAVSDVNEPPTAVILTPNAVSLAENTSTSPRIKVADIAVTDDALGSETLSLSGMDAEFFELSDTELYLKAGVSLNFESKPSYSVTVEADDTSIGSTFEVSANFLLNLTDVNESPTAVVLTPSSLSLPENLSTATRIKVADIAVTDDALGSEALGLSGTDAGFFELSGTELYLKAGVSLNFESKPNYSVTIEADDTSIGSAFEVSANFLLSLTDVNEAPTAVVLTPSSLSLPENSSTATRIKVADISVTDDALGSETLGLSGTDAGFFELSGTELYLKAGVSLNFESKSSYSVTVEADDTSIGSTFEVSANFLLSLTDVNEPPTAVVLTPGSLSLPENSSTGTRIKVADITVTDDALGSETLSLSGTDAGYFELSGTELYLKAGVPLDFEVKSSYSVTVEADDTSIGPTFDVSANFLLSLTDVNEAPTAIVLTPSSLSLAENTSTTTRIKVADFAVTDDALGSETLGLSGLDAALFELSGTELYLKSGVALDFEVKSSYAVTVEADDTTLGSTFDVSASFQLNVTDFNEAPTAVILTPTSVSLAENSSTATRIKVADVAVTDDALGSETLSLSGTDAAFFELSGTELYLKSGVSLNFESQSSYSVTVEADDTSIGSTFEGSTNFLLTLTDVNEAPTAVAYTPSSVALAENTSTATRIKVADVAVTDDALGSETLSLSGTDATLFELDGNELYLKAGVSLNFEFRSSYSVTVEVDDASIGSTFEVSANFLLTVADVNEVPTAVILTPNAVSLAENRVTTPRIKVAEVAVTDDALGSHTLSLTGTDAALFELDGAELYLRADTVLNFEARQSYSVSVEADDPTLGEAGVADATANFTIEVTDFNEAPTSVVLTPGSATLPETSSTLARTKVADIAVTDDALGSESFTLSGADAAVFELDGAELFLRAGVTLNFEVQASYSVTVEADDEALGSTYEASAVFSLDISDVNEAPSAVVLTPATALVAEDAPTLTRMLIASISVTDDALGSESLTLSGADAAFFELDGTALYLRAGVTLNFEVRSSYSVTVEADDASIGSTYEASAVFTLDVSDVNEAPTAVVLTPATVSLDENLSIPTRIKVADIGFTDDALGSNELSLSGADAIHFEIDSGALYLLAGTTLNYEMQSSYSVQIEVTDLSFGSDPQAVAIFTLNVNDVNEAPSAVSVTPTSTSLDENTPTIVRIKFADIAVTDDALGANVLSLSGADASVFEIDGTALYLRAGTVLNFEGQSGYTVTVEVNDTGVGSAPDASTSFVLTLSDVNEPPVLVSLTTVLATLAENSETAVRVKVASHINVSDDALGINAVSLAGDDAEYFELDGTDLYLKAGTALNFEAKSTYSIVVNVDDSDVGDMPDASTSFSLTITDINEAPTAVDLTSTTLSLSENVNTTGRIRVATLAVTDDALGDETFSLSGVDAADFEIDGNDLYLKAGTVLDYETQVGYSVTIKVDDISVGSTPDLQTNFTLAMDDINEAPTGLNATVVTATLAENTSTVARIKIAENLSVVDDALGANTLTLSGVDAEFFELDGDILYLKADTLLNFEAQSGYSVTVDVDDAAVGNTPDFSREFTLAITDVNEMPTGLLLTPSSMSLAEDTSTAGRIKIADITVIDDALGSEILTLSGADAALFELDGNELYLRAGVTLNFESRQSYSLTVNADDPTVGSVIDATATFTLNIADVNEAPTFVSLTPDSVSLAENMSTAARIKVADIVVTDDALGTNTLSLSGADSEFFELDGTELYLKMGTSLNFEAQSSYAVTVSADDSTSGSSSGASSSFELTITDVNEAPTDITLTPASASLPENTSTASRIELAVIAVTDDAVGTNTLSLSGPDAALFELDGTRLYLKAGTTLNFEVQQSYFLTVQVNDSGVGGDPDASADFTFSLTNVNEAPVPSGNALLSSVPEDTFNPTGATLASLFENLFVDPDDSASLSGVAVISNAGALSQGSWQYSTDGANWFNVGTVADDSTALALSASTHIRFQPAANFSGTPVSLSLRLLDDTYSGSFTSGAARHTVNAANNGGVTPVSVSSLTLGTSITAVADAPVVTSGFTTRGFTTLPLAILRNSLDGTEVTNFKITNIVNGSLTTANGDPVASGSFITAAEAGAGLRFTSTLLTSPSATFRFDVQGATSDSGAGLSAVSTVTIVVEELSGTWFVDGQAAHILQNGEALTIIGRRGRAAAGHLTSGTALTYEGAGPSAVVTSNRIEWSNGMIWTRHALSSIPELVHDWTAATGSEQRTHLEQQGAELLLTNRVGRVSRARLTSETTFVAYDWNLSGTFSEDHTRIDFTNGSVWLAPGVVPERVDLSGAWEIDGRWTQIRQLGNQLTLVDARGNVSPGTIAGDNATLTAGRFGNTGTLSGPEIHWSDGTTWTRATFAPPTISHVWTIVGGGIAQTDPNGGELLLTNKSGRTSRAVVRSSTEIYAVAWDLVGTLNEAGTVLRWSNGASWNAAPSDIDALFAGDFDPFD